jgi:hypothetical protein
LSAADQPTWRHRSGRPQDHEPTALFVALREEQAYRPELEGSRPTRGWGTAGVNWTELTELLDTVDGKWDLGILANLEAGPIRPTQLCRMINDEV